MEDGAGLGVCRAQRNLEKPGMGDEFRGRGVKRGSVPWRVGGATQGEEQLWSEGTDGAASPVSVLEAKRPQVHPALLEPPASWAPPWEAQSILESTAGSTRFPPGRSLHSGGASVEQSFSFSLSDSVLSLDDWRPGPVRPDPSRGRPAPGAAPLRSGVCHRSAAPAAKDASTRLPSGRPRWAPGSLAPHWDSGPWALVPPGPCSSSGSWLLSRSPCQNWASVYWRQITSERERVLREMEKRAFLLCHTRGTKQANALKTVS